VKSLLFSPAIALSALRHQLAKVRMKSLLSLLTLAAAILGNSAYASGSERIALPANLHPVWRAECVSCHPLYPPKLLTESDWKALMAGLDKHFGVNAGVDEKTREIITQALLEDAAPDSATIHHSETLRITDTPWHLARHKGRRNSEERKISNCSNCHKNEDDQLW
jgi:cytochrome c553